MNITTQAMLCMPSIRTWSARRYDDKATTTVAREHHSAKNMGRYNKSLIDPKAESFVAINKHHSELREWCYNHTLPWAQSGARILPAAEYLEFSSHMLKQKKIGERLYEEFLNEFPMLKEQAKHALNGLFREDDYPSAGELRGKYGIDVTYFPVPSADDFRVGIGEQEVLRIREQITVQVEAAAQDAMRNLWVRLHDATSKMAAALIDPERRFHDTLVTNVRELVELLPRLNLTNDTHLVALADEVKSQLTRVGPQRLRDEKDVREEQARKADALAKKMAPFMVRP